MTKLYGREFTRLHLLRLVGDISQIGGLRHYELWEGNQRGVEAVDFRTGTGFSFTVLPGRGMDISFAEYQGQALCWRSSTGEVAPPYFEPQGYGWLRSFFGGLLTTCGLAQIGEPCLDQGQSLGLHGRISNIPAKNVQVDAQWQGDEYLMWVQGKVQETSVLGENLCLTRKVSAKLGESRLFIHDKVENLGFEKTPHMILYHINAGYPVVDDGSELVGPILSFEPRDEEAKIEMEKYCQFQPPTPGFKERVYYLDLKPDEEGNVWVALINKRFKDGAGFGFYVRYKKQYLPILVEWKMMGEGCYVVGIEPANSKVEGRAKAREWGELKFLDPGELREYELEIGVLASSEEIGEFEKKIKGILGG